MTLHPGRPTLAAILVTTSLATGANAQTSDRPFDDLARYLKPDDTVYVVGRSSGETRGSQASVSGPQLTVTTESGQQPMRSTEIAWIEKRGDAVWNGAFVGAGAAAILVAGAAGSSCSDDCASVVGAGAAYGAGIGAGIGALIDWLHPGRTLVYGTRPPSVHAMRAEPPVDSIGLLWSRVRPGDAVSVRRSSGDAIAGRFVRATNSTLVIDSGGQQLQTEGQEIVSVTRKGSQLGRGVVIGPAVVAALTMTAALSNGSSAGETAFAAGVGAIGGLVWGALIGRVVPRRIAAFVHPAGTVRAEPILAPGQRGIRFTVGY